MEGMFMDQPAGADVRCSAVVFCGDEVLLVGRIRDGDVLETQGPRSGLHTVDLVFLATVSVPRQEPRSSEPNLTARFLPLGLLNELDLRPPMAGHLRGLHARRTVRTAPYLGNLWRPRLLDDSLPVLLEFGDEPAAREMR
jgi:hypothetical protein